MNAKGDTVWTAAIDNDLDFSQDYANAIAISNTGDVYLGGILQVSGSLDKDFLLVHYDADGNEQWRATYSGSANFIDEFYKILIDDQGYIYVGGVTNKKVSGKMNQDIILIKYNTSGDTVWTRIYDSAQPKSTEKTDNFVDMHLDPNGDLVVSASAHIRADWVLGDLFGALILKYDLSGKMLFDSLYVVEGGSAEVDASGLDADGNIFLYVHGKNNLEHGILKFDNNGAFKTKMIFEPDSSSWKYLTRGFTVDATGNATFVARVQVINKWPGAWANFTVSYNKEGQLRWQHRSPTRGPIEGGDKFVHFNIQHDASGNVYTTQKDGDYLVIEKFNSSGKIVWTVKDDTLTDRSGGNFLGVCALTVDNDGHIFVAHTLRSNYIDYIRTIEFDSNIPTEINRTAIQHILQKLQLYQNYPNPFNPQTKIGFTLTAPTPVNLSIYDVLGRKITTLVKGIEPIGFHHVNFDGSNLPSGIYYCQLKSGSTTLTRKMLLIK